MEFDDLSKKLTQTSYFTLKLQFVMPRLGWRWLLALSALPSSLLLLFYQMTPESPRYLCMKGRKGDALAILEKIARVNGRKLPPGVLISDSHIELEEKSEFSEDAKLISSAREKNGVTSPKSAGSQKSGVSLLKMLLSPELVRSTLLLWVVFFGNAFTYYGLVLLTTELNNNSNRCVQKQLPSGNHQDVSYKDVFITSFAGNLIVLISEFDCLTLFPEKIQIIIYINFFLQEFPGLLLSAATVDKLGRKNSMAAMFFLCFIFLLPLAFHQPQSLTTALLFGARICITGTFTILYIYAPEVRIKIN